MLTIVTNLCSPSVLVQYQSGKNDAQLERQILKTRCKVKVTNVFTLHLLVRLQQCRRCWAYYCPPQVKVWTKFLQSVYVHHCITGKHALHI